MALRRGLVLALAFASARLGSAAEGKKPGEFGYCTTLKDLHTNCPTAKMPEFNPDAERIVVEVEDVYATEITFFMTIFREKYAEGGVPTIWKNGKKIKYDPLKDINFTIPLDKTIDAVELDVMIKVEDPFVNESPLAKVQTNAAHEYKISIKKAPQWAKVLEAQTIKLTNAKGKEIVATDPKPFDKNAKASQYFYDIEDMCEGKDDKGLPTCMIDVQVKCSDFASGLRIDMQNAASGEVFQRDMTNSAETVIMAECYYDNEKWTKGYLQSRMYSIVLKREIPFEGNVMVQTFAYQGVCDKMIEKGERSFDCRAVVDEVKLIIHATMTAMGDQMTLTSSKEKFPVKVRSGIPFVADVPKKGHEKLELTLTQGTDVVKFPILLHKPAGCETMTCPSSMALKEPSQNAIDHACHDDPCDPKVDTAFCCGDRVTCARFEEDGNACPKHHILHHSPQKIMCEDTVCKEKDTDTCCMAQATCDTFNEGLCPDYTYLRNDAKQVYCEDDICTEEDTKICCVSMDRQSCGYMDEKQCEKGTVKRMVKPWQYYCKHKGGCDENDAALCCVPPAKCTTHECPENRPNLKKNASLLLCKQEVCSEEDTGTCCQVEAPCSTITCPEEKVKRWDVESLWCAGAHCTDDDIDTCCAAQETCDALEDKCPDGQGLADRADERYCLADRCTEKDEPTCCQERDTCANYPSDCGKDKKIWKEGLCEKQVCTDSHEDTRLCCLVKDVERAGIIRIMNVDFEKLGKKKAVKQVEAIISGSVTSHLGVAESKMELAISPSKLKDSLICNFLLDVAGLGHSQVVDIETKFLDMSSVAADMASQLLALLGEDAKAHPDQDIVIPSILLADAMLDGTHGAMRLPALVLKISDDDEYTLKLPHGIVQDGVPSTQVEKTGSSGDIKVGSKVNALCTLFVVSQWLDDGTLPPAIHDAVLEEEEEEVASEDAKKVLAETFEAGRIDIWRPARRFPQPATAAAAGCAAVAALGLAALLHRRRGPHGGLLAAAAAEERELLEAHA